MSRKPPRARTATRVAHLGGIVAALDRGGRRRWLFPLLSACAGALALLAVAGAGGLPQPNIHDEFSYLLGADTFAHGRLANPPHPLWEFFETIHVISQPAWASKYQPGQALFLALGQVLFGHPYYGVVIANALLFASLCWMLEVWLAPAWGLIGAALAILSIAGGHYWGFSYWGGSAAAMAGSVLLGSWHRIVRGGCARYGWPAGCAAVLLLWIRPFEGGLLCAALAAGAAWRLRGRLLFSGAIPAAAVLAAGLAGQLLYNRAVTGSALELPYALYTRQYQVVPSFWPVATAPSKVYTNDALRLQETVWEPMEYERIHRMPAAQRAAYLGQRLIEGLGAIAPITPWLPFALLFWHDRRLRFLLATALAGGAALCLETWMYPHYLAPWFPLVLLVGLASLRRLRGMRWRGRAAGAPAAAVLLALAFGAAALRAATEIHYYLHPVRYNVGRERARLAANLEARGGRHVVLVRYAPTHDVSQEWVYNGPDIDGARLVWARDRGAVDNERLLRHFAGRSFWLLEPDANPPSLQPYPAGTK